MQKLYPINLNIEGKRCLIVGGGTVALRKIKGLLDAGADVHVVAPEICDAIGKLPVTIHQRLFEPNDVAGSALVIAASDDQAANEAAARTARDRQILVNVVDQPPLCDFYVPAVLRRGGLVISVSTSGAAPAFAGKLRRDLEEEYGPEYADILDILEAVRQKVITSDKEPAQRKKILTRIANLDLEGEYRRSGRRALKLTLMKIIQEE